MSDTKVGMIRLKQHLVDTAEPGMILEVKAGPFDGTQLRLLERTEEIGVWTVEKV